MLQKKLVRLRAGFRRAQENCRHERFSAGEAECQAGIQIKQLNSRVQSHNVIGKLEGAMRIERRIRYLHRPMGPSRAHPELQATDF